MKVDRNDEAKTSGIGERKRTQEFSRENSRELKSLHEWKEWDLKCKSKDGLG